MGFNSGTSKQELIILYHQITPFGQPESLSQFGIFKDIKDVIRSLRQNKKYSVYHMFTTKEGLYWKLNYKGPISSELSAWSPKQIDELQIEKGFPISKQAKYKGFENDWE